MNPADRMKAAFCFQQPDDYVPIWELEFHLFRDILGQEPVLGYEFAKLTDSEKRYAIEINTDIIVQAQEKFDYSAVTIPSDYWEQAPGEPAYYWIKGLDWRLEHIRILKKKLGGKCLVVADAASNICIPTSGNDLLDLIYKMADSPEEIIELNETIIKNGIESGFKMIEAGADIIYNASDIAFNQGLFFSPEQLEKFIFPYFIRWNKAIKQQGVYTVLHTDGNIEAIIDDICNCGFDGLQCIDPIAGMDIVALKKKTDGRITLIGNMNVSTLQLGSKTDIEQQARDILFGCKDGGGFVFGCCNAVFRGIPPENYLFMHECWKKYGSYFD